MSITLAVNADDIFGAGPPPVFFCSFVSSLNSFFACECKFRHFSRTSAVVRIATPTAFTASAIFSTFHFFLIGDVVGELALYQRKVFFDFFRQNGNFWSAKILFSSFAWDSRGSHFAALTTSSPWQHCMNSLLWDANRGLNAINPRLANLSSNRASNNAILTAS